MAGSSAEQLAAAAWKLHQMGRLPEAINLYRQAAKLAPGYAEIHNNLGNALRAAGKPEDAAVSLARAIKLKPAIASAHSNLGLTLGELGRLEEAVASHRRALALEPNLALAHNNLGIALLELRQLDEATVCLRRALELDPGLGEAHANLGDALRLMEDQTPGEAGVRCLTDAIESYRRAIALNPFFAEAYANMGDAQARLGDLASSAASFRRALELKPGYGQALAQYAGRLRAMCDWRDKTPLIPAFVEAAKTNAKGAMAFSFLAIADDPALQFEMARHDCRVLAELDEPAVWRGKKYRHDKIRLAYLSADFNQHAVGFSIAPLFERHDRSRFEVHGVSFGRDDGSAIGERLRAAVDRFHDVRGSSDKAIAQAIREAEIDIAIDLMGHTRGARLGILARRPAPIQASYLGYPGSTGASFIDYMIADPVVAPLDNAAYFSEKIVHLPPSYLFNDAGRAIAEVTPTRSECGLPENGFVFCCFNNGYKLSPRIFDIWARLLAQIPDSVLWLRADNRWIVENLRRELAERGGDAERLIFAPTMKLADHLARHRLAGLFLDTLPYNAHSTAIDALWAGLPVLTCCGQSFPGRVASSLLQACGLPELITRSPEEYEAKALALARQPAELNLLRSKLERNRSTCPLFDNEGSTRHIEAAYHRMWEHWQAGRAPASIAVELA
jgi:protein O-GlcNAc transferase